MFQFLGTSFPGLQPDLEMSAALSIPYQCEVGGWGGKPLFYEATLSFSECATQICGNPVQPNRLTSPKFAQIIATDLY